MTITKCQAPHWAPTPTPAATQILTRLEKQGKAKVAALNNIAKGLNRIAAALKARRRP
jgi:hypothetical protein